MLVLVNGVFLVLNPETQHIEICTPRRRSSEAALGTCRAAYRSRLWRESYRGCGEECARRRGPSTPQRRVALRVKFPSRLSTRSSWTISTSTFWTNLPGENTTRPRLFTTREVCRGSIAPCGNLRLRGRSWSEVSCTCFYAHKMSLLGRYSPKGRT